MDINKFFQVFSIVAISAIIFLLVRMESLQSKFDLGMSAKEESEMELSSLDEELKELRIQNKADELFIAGNYDSAFALYKSLGSEERSLDLLQRRKARTGMSDSLLLQFSAKEKQQYQQMSEMQMALNRQLLVVDSVFNVKADSIRAALSKEKKQLEKQLAEKEKVLSNTAKNENLVFYSKNGTRTTYFGETKSGKANGHGMGYYTTGNMYVGLWKNNLKHGPNGTYRWLSGERYEGDYVDDKRSGNGTYYWPNGEKYEGEWLNDMRHGTGTMYDKDNNVKVSGTWKNGELVN